MNVDEPVNLYGSIYQQCWRKQAHATRKAARAAARRAQRLFGYSLRVYRCPICGQWHKTKRLV